MNSIEIWTKIGKLSIKNMSLKMSKNGGHFVQVCMWYALMSYVDLRISNSLRYLHGYVLMVIICQDSTSFRRDVRELTLNTVHGIVWYFSIGMKSTTDLW